MKELPDKLNRKKGFSRIGLTLVLFLIILIITYAVYKLFFLPNPVVRGVEAFKLLPVEKTIMLYGENLNSINIAAYQGDKKIVLLRDTPEKRIQKYVLDIKPKDLGLTDGIAIIKVKAKASILKGVSYEIDSKIDTVPPTLEVLKAPSFIYRGSGGFIVLKAKGADTVFIKLENLTFKAFDAPFKKDLPPQSSQKLETEPQHAFSTQNQTAKTYYALFPAPFNIHEERLFYAVAEDAVGNQNIKKLPTRLKIKKYGRSSITIDDTLMNMVVFPLLNKADIANPENAFKKLNEEWRRKSLKKLTDIAQTTEEKIFLEGPFLQLKNSKVMATYGDERTYIYNGKPISKSIHLGYDLASFANAPVEAANNGIVRFAGDLGIYGNTVIIDHGLGLMSLYGHLSTIMVTEGQAVKKGAIIAKTGSTGFASGDHLHFGILLHGYEVSPLYWWDQKWIKLNVLDYLNSQV
jgi:murein DD-endopeptidase MepM/ murein hydrolase activator NlpD